MESIGKCLRMGVGVDRLVWESPSVLRALGSPLSSDHAVRSGIAVLQFLWVAGMFACLLLPFLFQLLNQ